MHQIHVTPTVEMHCDWCGRTPQDPLITVTVVTSRIVFHDEICEDCRKAFLEDVD